MPHKINYPSKQEQREIGRTREVLDLCMDVLRQPPPDTFLGRQRHELIPPSYDQDGPTVAVADGGRLAAPQFKEVDQTEPLHDGAPSPHRD